jgi:hypothetical protein
MSVHPSVDGEGSAGRRDVLPAGALAVVGGPLGRYAGPRAGTWPVRLAVLLALMTATMALGTVERAHCIEKGWNGSDQFWHGCFSDLPALYQLGHLSGGLPAYLSGGAGAPSLDHPVVTGSVMALLGGFVGGGTVTEQVRWYFILWVLLATLLMLAAVFFTAASRPRHLADAALVALSPVVALASLVSADVVGVALLSAALWAWSRRSVVGTGVLLGLAIGARTYPVLVLLALLVLALRTGRGWTARTLLISCGATLLVVALPFLVANPVALTSAYTAWWQAAPNLGSLGMLGQLFGRPLSAGAGTGIALLGMAAAAAISSLLALTAPRRPTVAEVALVGVGIVLVTGKSVPVQASLWLVPLVALCGLRWRDKLLWAGAEAVHFVAVWLYVAGGSDPNRMIRPSWYAVILLVRLAAILYLIWRAWTQAQARLPREADPEGEWPDDPDRDDIVDELAGDFRERPDRVLVTYS